MNFNSYDEFLEYAKREVAKQELIEEGLLPPQDKKTNQQGGIN